MSDDGDVPDPHPVARAVGDDHRTQHFAAAMLLAPPVAWGPQMLEALTATLLLHTRHLTAFFAGPGHGADVVAGHFADGWEAALGGDAAATAALRRLLDGDGDLALRLGAASPARVARTRVVGTAEALALVDDVNVLWALFERTLPPERRAWFARRG